MKKNQILPYLLIPFLFLLISKPSFTIPLKNYQPHGYGEFSISNLPGWSYNSGQSTGDFYVFNSSQQGTNVSIKKQPVECETKQALNAAVLKIIQGLPKNQEYMEQRKMAAPYPCLGQQFCHMLKVKSRATGQRKFVLNPYVDGKMYQIEISAGQNNVPPPEALIFINQISLSGSTDALAQTIPQAPQRQQTTPQNQNTPKATPPSQEVDEGLSSFKKNKSVPPPPKPVQNTAPEIKKENKQISPSPTIKNSGESFHPDVKVPEVNIDKGNIPVVKFSATDPCSPSNPGKNGLPWESEQASKIELPEGVDAAIPDPIPNIGKLSDVKYNSAVSAAFEGMNLIYGEMPDDEAKKFQAAWAPLFDFPAQEIIDYLNKLNPIVSQFLTAREGYIRNMNAATMLLLDASTAIGFEDQQAWEAAMTEAEIYTLTLPHLEAAMKQLVKQLEALGNPPSPVDAKCEARRLYNKVFEKPKKFECSSPLTGEWVGYSESDSYKKFQERKIENIVFTTIKSNVPFAEEPQCQKTEYSLDPNLPPLNKEWASIPKIERWNAPISRNGLINNEELKEAFDDSKTQIEFTVQTEAATYKYVLERATNQNINNTITQGYEKLEKLEKQAAALEKKRKEIENSYDLENSDSFTPWENNKEWNKAVEDWGHCDAAIRQLKSYLPGIPVFHGAAQYWLSNLNKEVYDFMNETDIVDFTRMMQDVVKNTLPAQEETLQAQTDNIPEENDLNNDSGLKISEESKKEYIALEQELINVVQHNLDREIAERDRVVEEIKNSKTKKESDAHEKRLKQLNLNIIHFQSNIQEKQDLITSYKTGQVVHTRTAFDEYAQYKFIQGVQENVEKVEMTRRIAERIYRQIRLLPIKQQAKAREMAEKVIDGKTIASGDVDKARRLAESFNNQIQGSAEFDGAQAKEAEATAKFNEDMTQIVIVAAGAGAIGFGAAALTQAFGAEAAVTIYGTKALGAIYGGTTGFIAGGPKEGLTGAVSWWSPNGYALTQFVEGYQHGSTKKDATTSTKAWEGAKQAGKAWLLGKCFEYGIKAVTKVALWKYGPDSRLFKPIVNTTGGRQQQLDAMKSKVMEKEAEEIVMTFEKLEQELTILKLDEVANAAKIQQMEAELQQLAASMNASYHAKWYFKYKASPRTMRRFDARVQQNYANMEPGMIQRMEAMGYKMDGVRFKQFRNGGSGGTSSMDLDLVPVGQTTGKPRTVFMKKDGTIVSAKDFMVDCQKAMHAEYYKQVGITAKSSEMNLVTSAHREAFANSKLLDKNIDMSTFTDDEIKSIGEVLKAKREGIEANQMLTQTNKTQAKCREAAKEVENMLLRKLRSDLQQVPPGSSQARAIQQQIDKWEKILASLKRIGMKESDPLQIMRQCESIRRESGGKDVHGVIDDVITFFGAAP